MMLQGAIYRAMRLSGHLSAHSDRVQFLDALATLLGCF